MNGSVLIAVVGKTDPIRGLHDGPILHIVRWYRPERAVLILTAEIERDEKEYHYMEDAIHLLDSQCQVEIISTGILQPHSYDDFSIPFLDICNQIRNRYPNRKVLLNISSGTPQMETAMCMIAISEPSVYIPVQVASPERSANKAPFFKPQEDLIEEWFELNEDNESRAESRCHEPKLLNFKRPMLQSQIISLIQNFDYAGAWQLYQDNQKLFSKRVGLLLEHAKYRLNLEYKEAEALADQLGSKDILYPVKRSDVARLIEFFNSMCVKQSRGELNDFSMRLEIMTEYLAIYILENCMRIKRSEITNVRKLKNSEIMYLSKSKCVSKIPGIDVYLDLQFSDKKGGAFEWGKAINALSLVHIVQYMATQERFKKYEMAAGEMLQWVQLSTQVRNPAAHTIISITEDLIRKSYSNKDSQNLCNSMRTILRQVFGSEGKDEAFKIYERINELVKAASESKD